LWLRGQARGAHCALSRTTGSVEDNGEIASREREIRRRGCERVCGQRDGRDQKHIFRFGSGSLHFQRGIVSFLAGIIALHKKTKGKITEGRLVRSICYSGSGEDSGVGGWVTGSAADSAGDSRRTDKASTRKSASVLA